MPKQTKLPPYRDGVEADELTAEWLSNPKRSGRGLMSEGAVRELIELALDPAPLRDAAFMLPGGDARWREFRATQRQRLAEIRALPEPERTRQISRYDPNAGYSEHYGMKLARMIADHPDEAPRLWTWAREQGERRIQSGVGVARIAARHLHLAAGANGTSAPKPEAIADRVKRRYSRKISTDTAEAAVKVERRRSRKLPRE